MSEDTYQRMTPEEQAAYDSMTPTEKEMAAIPPNIFKAGQDRLPRNPEFLEWLEKSGHSKNPAVVKAFASAKPDESIREILNRAGPGLGAQWAGRDIANPAGAPDPILEKAKRNNPRSLGTFLLGGGKKAGI